MVVNNSLSTCAPVEVNTIIPFSQPTKKKKKVNNVITLLLLLLFCACL